MRWRFVTFCDWLVKSIGRGVRLPNRLLNVEAGPGENEIESHISSVQAVKKGPGHPTVAAAREQVNQLVVRDCAILLRLASISSG
jgi:hypothetical protein